MKLTTATLLAAALATIAAQGRGQSTPSYQPFQHIVIIVQENRTPDNLFQGLCQPPFGSILSCNTQGQAGKYNIAQISAGPWPDETVWLHTPSGGSYNSVSPAPRPLGISWDPSHTHTDFQAMCCNGATSESCPAPKLPALPPPKPPYVKPTTGSLPPCTNGGAAKVGCDSGNNCPSMQSFSFVCNDDSGGTACPGTPPPCGTPSTICTLDPYLTLATQYGFANYMFQTNQGPSFAAHQFLYGGTSAPSAPTPSKPTLPNDDGKAIFASELPNKASTNNAPFQVGCSTNAKAQASSLPTSQQPGAVEWIFPTGEEVWESCKGKNPPCGSCFEHNVMSDLLELRSLKWKYYAPQATDSFWVAPNAIEHVCKAGGTDRCHFPSNVDLTPTTVENQQHVLTDINNCALPSVSWVIPAGQYSDHAGSTENTEGPSWVAAIVNAIGKQPKCPNGETYWYDTAIVITWDDWGGWYDHESPPQLPLPQGYYQYGFRVPLLVVSAQTVPGTVSNKICDFGSILRFVETNFNIPPVTGATQGLGFADQRSAKQGFSDLSEFFNTSGRPFTVVAAQLDADFFLADQRGPTPPDTD